MANTDELKNELVSSLKPTIRKGETNVEIKKEDMEVLYDAYLLSEILKVKPTETKFFKDFAKDDYQESMFSTFIKPSFTTDFIRNMFIELKIAGLFDRINIPRNPFKIPTLVSEHRAWLKTEATTFAHRLGGPAAGEITFDVKTIMTAAQLTDEVEEDSIVPILPILKEDINYSIQYAIEDAVMNGSTTSVGWDADLIDADDSRLAWGGLRKYAIDNSLTKELDGTNFTTDNLLILRAMMGKYGVDVSKLAIIVSPKGYAKLLGLDEVLTMDKFGPKATILTGEQAKFLGMPIIISEAVRDDVSATGINTAPSDPYTTLMMLYRPSFAVGTLRDLKFEPYRDPSVGNRLYVSTRLDFKLRAIGTPPVVVLGIKV